MRFYAGVPLVTSSGYALGTLCLADGNPRSFSASELERLQVFARRIAAELQLSGEVERTRALQAELEAIAKYATTLAELSMGHAVGDLCLQQVATALSEQIRPRDSRFLFRLGGDELALVLPVPESAHPEMGCRLESAVSRLAAEAYPTLDLHLDLGAAEVPGGSGGSSGGASVGGWEDVRGEAGPAIRAKIRAEFRSECGLERHPSHEAPDPF